MVDYELFFKARVKGRNLFSDFNAFEDRLYLNISLPMRIARPCRIGLCVPFLRQYQYPLQEHLNYAGTIFSNRTWVVNSNVFQHLVTHFACFHLFSSTSSSLLGLTVHFPFLPYCSVFFEKERVFLLIGLF